MSRLGGAPIGVYSDDGAVLEAIKHPNGNLGYLVASYANTALMYADLNNGLLPVGLIAVNAGNREFIYNGTTLTELAVTGSNNFPHVNVAHSVIRTFLNNQGSAHVNEPHRQALEIALPPLLASTAWAKIVELWVPLGADLIGALVKLKYPSGNSATLTNHNFVAGDYTPTSGLTGDGSTKYLTSDANPSSLGLTANNWGLAVHTPSLPVNSSGLAASSVMASLVQSTHFFYVNGQLYNQFVYDNDILTPTAQSYLNYNNGSGNVTPPWGVARTAYVNSYNGVTAAGCSGFMMQSVSSSSGNVVPNATVSLFSIGVGNCSQATLTGYALFTGMTQAELQVLGAFFDTVNHLAYRPVFDGLLAFGDSIIRGNSTSNYLTKRWTQLLANQLGLTLTNYGMDGSTMSICPTLGNGGTANTYNCFEYDPTTNGTSPTSSQKGFLALPLQNSGALVCIGLGINDLSYSGNLTNYIKIYTQTLTQLKQAGFNMSNVLIAGITYASNSGGSAPANGYYTSALCQIWNSALANLAAQFDCIFVDMFSLWNSSNSNTYLNADGIHPNDAGHALMANQALAAYNAARNSTIALYVPVN